MKKKEKKKEKFNVFGLIALIIWDLSCIWMVLAIYNAIGMQSLSIILIVIMIIIDILAMTQGNKWLIIFGCICLIWDFMNMSTNGGFHMLASALLIVAGIVGIMSNKKIDKVDEVSETNTDNVK